jgi:hypothetical protein
LSFLKAEPEADFHESIGQLASLSLIKRFPKHGTIQIHSMVHEWIHLRMTSEECGQWFETALILLSRLLPPLIYPLTDAELPQQSQLVLSHVQRITELLLLYSDYINCPAECATLLLELYLWYQGWGLLELAVAFIYKIPQWEEHWLSDLTYGCTVGPSSADLPK